MKLFVNIIFLKTSGEKSPKRKTILTMVLHQNWGIFTFNEFFLRIFKLIATEKFRGISVCKKKKSFADEIICKYHFFEKKWRKIVKTKNYSNYRNAPYLANFQFKNGF